jgi:hypothetical protein
MRCVGDVASCAGAVRCRNTRFHFHHCGRMVSSVKITSLLIFGLLFTPVCAGDPGTAALDFLGKVRDGQLDLDPGTDTALQEHTTKGKREMIRKSMTRLEKELRGGRLELGEVREDEGFAAVMIRKTGGFDSAEMQIFPVALVKRGEDWLPAPVLASFENAVAAYTVQLKGRLATLENWMMRQRVADLERLVAESSERTRNQIRDSIVGEDLEGDDLGRIADRFLRRHTRISRRPRGSAAVRLGSPAQSLKGCCPRGWLGG